jgi:hypothetical protein
MNAKEAIIGKRVFSIDDKENGTIIETQKERNPLTKYCFPKNYITVKLDKKISYLGEELDIFVYNPCKLKTI